MKESVCVSVPIHGLINAAEDQNYCVVEVRKKVSVSVHVSVNAAENQNYCVVEVVRKLCVCLCVF